MPKPFNPSRRKNSPPQESTEPFDWGSFSIPAANDKPEEKKPPSSVFDSVLEDDGRPQSRSDNNRNNRRPNPKRNAPQKPKTDEHDKKELKLNRSNIMPHSPSDEVQVNAYINLLDEFIGNTENFVASSAKTSNTVPSMIDDFLICLKSLIIDDDSKEAVLQKLMDLQDVINSKIKSLTDVNYNRTENWVMKNQMGRSINNLDKIEVASNKSDARSIPRSNLSAKNNAAFKISPEELKVVNCQFCNELQPNLSALIKHLDNNCQKFRDRDFDNSRRNDFSPYQILPTDAIKCNLCDTRLSTLLGMKEHDMSKKHKEQLKSKARDSRRAMTTFIFCSCCRVNVPDNFIQFKMHLENAEHIQNKTKKLDVFDLAETGTQIIIVSKNKVKCLSCHNKEFFYEKDVFKKHLTDDIHMRNVKRRGKDNNTPIYCELCSVHLQTFGVDLHVTSPLHQKHLQDGTSPSETSMKNHYCVFCKKGFSDLKNLAVHQESSCPDIRNIRQLHQKGNDSSTKKENDALLVGASAMSGRRGGEDEDEEDEDEPILLDSYEKFFKDMGWIQQAAELLKAKSDKCDTVLDQSIAQELAREVKCKKCFIFGSRSCGLAFENCDLNILCDFSTGTEEVISKISLKIAGEECYEILKNSKNFTKVELVFEGGEPYIQCVHNSGRNCKIVFRKDISELETDFFKKCMKNDCRIQQFLLVLKLWLKVHTSYIGEWNSFVLMMLGVFFLRSRGINVLPLPSEELVDASRFDNAMTVSQLFYKFVSFFSSFDYSTKMIHTGFGEPLQKQDFISFLTVNKLKGDGFTEDKSLWIASNQNSNCNVGKNVNKVTVKKFVKACRFTKDRLDD